MSHKKKVISYTEHQDYLRELKRSSPKYDCCALYCEAIGFLSRPQSNLENDEGFKVLRPIIGVVSVDLRMPEHPLLGLYKNLYHYPHIRMGRSLLFAAMLRASELGLTKIFLECYSKNVVMQQLARQLGFSSDSQSKLVAEGDMRGKLLSFQRSLPSRKKLLQDPMFSDFGELYREAKSLQDKEYLH